MPKPNRSSLVIRLGIVAVGVCAGLALRYAYPPSFDPMVEATDQGTMRAQSSDDLEEQERASAKP